MMPPDASQRSRDSLARSRTDRPTPEGPENTRLSSKHSVPIPVPVKRPWITVKEAALYLGVGVDTIYKAIATGGLKHSRLGHSTIRLRREWVDAWAETQTRQSS